jgi:pyruvate,water dikinase
MGLAQLLTMGVNVPNGFVISTTTLRHYLESNDLTNYMDPCVLAARESVDLETEISRRLLESEIPHSIAQEIQNNYENLLEHSASPYVVARSSSVLEDSSTLSFAGQYSSFLGIRNLEELYLAVKKCWASQFSARVLEYLRSHALPTQVDKMGVIIQQLVPSEKAGVLLTSHPISHNKHTLVIEANWGFGGTVVAGQVIPDHIEFNDQETDHRITYIVGSKAIKLELVNDRMEYQNVPSNQQDIHCLSEEEVASLAMLGRRIEMYLGYPVDIEWAIYANTICFLQVRPITSRITKSQYD